MKSTNFSNINFNQIKSLMSSDDEEISNDEMMKKINGFKDSNNHLKLFEFCRIFLIKNEKNVNVNNDFLNLVKIELFRVSNVLLLENIKEKKFEDVKLQLSTIDLIKPKTFEMFFLANNNRSCYFWNIGFEKNAIQIADLCYKISLTKTIRDIEISNKIKTKNLATCALQLCSYNQVNHKKSYIHGLNSLALLQFKEVFDNLKTRVTNSNTNLQKNDEENENENEKEFNTEEFMENNVDNSSIQSNIVLAYYNIGVQLEFLKRFNDSKISFKKAYFFNTINSNICKELIKKLSNLVFSSKNNIKRDKKNNFASSTSLNNDFEHNDENINSKIIMGHKGKRNENIVNTSSADSILTDIKSLINFSESFSLSKYSSDRFQPFTQLIEKNKKLGLSEIKSIKNQNKVSLPSIHKEKQYNQVKENYN